MCTHVLDHYLIINSINTPTRTIHKVFCYSIVGFFLIKEERSKQLLGLNELLDQVPPQGVYNYAGICI